MSDFWFLFWIGLSASILGALFGALFDAPRLWQQMRCKHKRYFETTKCDAICIDCGKNLGFIGNLRRKEHE